MCFVEAADFQEEFTTLDEVQNLEEEGEVRGDPEDSSEEMDPRLQRKKRQAIYPYYPLAFSTRRSRRKLDINIVGSTECD